MKLNPAPHDLAAVLEECFLAVAQEGGGIKKWLAWRQWRAEWLGRLTLARMQVEHYGQVFAGGDRRPLDEILKEAEHAAAMVALLEDCAELVRSKAKKVTADGRK